MGSLIAHEFTHIIQNSQRFVLNNGLPMPSWEAEGQATFAQELNGDNVLGNSSGQNYGATVAFSSAGFSWYGDEFVFLGEYFGDQGANRQVANAPDQCTLFGSPALTTPCSASYFYGTSWSLQRYVADQYAGVYSGGLVQLTRDWVSKYPSLTGMANVRALLGVNTDSLFARWATMLALDDLNNGTGTAWVPVQFQLTSWNLADIANYLGSKGFGWLAPTSRTFQSFLDARSVRAGSTAYTFVSSAGGHTAAAIAITDQSSGTLSTALRPAVWVVRIQ
jgi:hypothetical protein